MYPSPDIEKMTAQEPIPGAGRSMEWVCDRSLAGVAGYIPAGEMDVCLSVCCECCVMSRRRVCDRPVPRPEESYLVVCLSVTVQQDDEEALADYGLSHHGKIITAQEKQ